MNQDISELIFQKAKRKELAHFYLIENSYGQTDEELTHWLMKLLEKIISQIDLKDTRQVDLKNYMDLLWIAPDEDNKQYNVDDFEELWKFLSFNSINLSQRYIIITEAHLLTPIIMNKLLKVLEEPQEKITFFMLNPRAAKLLPTLLSRAVILSPLKPVISNTPHLNEFKSLLMAPLISFVEFSKKMKEFNLSEEDLAQYLLTEIIHPKTPHNIQQKFLNLVPQLIESRTFNQNKEIRLFWLWELSNQLKK